MMHGLRCMCRVFLAMQIAAKKSNVAVVLLFDAG